MKRLSWLFVMVLLVSPAFGQDDSGGDGGLGDGGGLFGGGGGNAGGNRGGQAAAVDRLVTLRDMLAKASAPLTKDQEKALNTLLDREIKTMTEALRAKFPEEAEAPASDRGGQRPGQPDQVQGRGQRPEAGQAPPAGQARGGTRGGFRGGAGVVVDTPLTIEIRRMNEELLGKVTASLKPEQQVIIKKWENDQIRARGGLDALKLTMNEAGAPLTAEQIPQVQALYAELNQSRAQLLRETQGQPDAAKLSQLDLATMSKVAKLLNDNQRKALLESMAKSRQ